MPHPSRYPWMGHGGGGERRGPDEDPDDYFRDPGEEEEAEERKLVMAQETADAGPFAAVYEYLVCNAFPNQFKCRDCKWIGIYQLPSQSSCRNCGSVSREAHTSAAR